MSIIKAILANFSAPPTQAKQLVQPDGYLHETTDFGSDQYARINGQDLSVNGEHPAPSGLDAYGMNGEMGWSYQFDKATRK